MCLMMQCPRKLKVTDLNPHLICVLCGGYYVDATTIIECLHSFCKSCIVRYLETNKYCPICDVQVHKTRPLQKIRPDKTLQTIVYKLVPGLYQNEMRCRREFYAKHPEAKPLAVSPEARGEHTEQSSIFLPDESVSLCLEYVGSSDVQVGQGTCGRRYLRCPAAVSVFHIHKLIRAKFALTMGHRVDVFYKDDLLPENLSLMDVAYIYQWKRKSPIHMTYRILESQRKRIKLSHDSASSCESFPTKSLCSNLSGSGISEPSVSTEISGSLVPLSTASSSLPPSETAPSNVVLPSDSTFTTVGTITTSTETNSIVTSTTASTAVTSTTAVTLAPAEGISSSLVGSVTAVTGGDIVVGSTSTTTTTTTTSTSTATVKKENPIEWKEVQLQISENGVMSVAGIDNRLLTPLQSVSVPTQNKNTDASTNNVSVKPDIVDERPENKVPHVDSDLNSSALQDKDIQCESRTKLVETQPSENKELIPSNTVSNNESVKESDLNIKSDSKDNKLIEIKSNSEDSKPTDVGLPSVKPISHKLPSTSDKNNSVYKSKTDKLEDTVRNISNRTDPLLRPDINNVKPVHLSPQVTKDDNANKSDVCSSVDGVLGKLQRPLILSRKHKVYPGIKPVYNASPKEENLKMNNMKIEPSVVPTKMTPMEILNTHKKPANTTVKYKTLKTPIKPWNPSIPRAAALSMKHSQSSSAHNKDVNSTASSESQVNPPPPKQPRFFKMRNMPRFLGNPSSGVKPMYQVAPGSELVSHSNNPVSTSSSTPSTSGSSSNNSSVVSSAAVVTSVFPSVSVSPVTCTSVTSATSVTTTASSGTAAVSSTNSPLVATPSVTITSNSSVTAATNLTSVSLPPHTTSAAHSSAVQKNNKPSGSSGVTLMKIDPKTLSPITASPMVSHVLNNPPRSTSSPQPKKLPPPFTPGSPKHSNHYSNCRTAHSNMNTGKSTIPRIPSPAHTGGLINPFLPSVVHPNPHLLYSAFTNPFSPDPANSRLMTGPSNSELIRAMSALCSSGSAFHSLPPTISMLFNPHHAHHRALQPDRNSFKCSSNDKQSTQSPPPAVQRIPPSNPPGKNLNETEVPQQGAINSLSSVAETQLNSCRLKKDGVCESSSTGAAKSSQINPPPKKVISTEHVNQQQDSRLQPQQSHVVNSNLKNCTVVLNSIRSESKDIKPLSSHFSKSLKPGEKKIEEVTMELLKTHKSESNKTTNGGSHVENQSENKVVESKLALETKPNKEFSKISKSKDEHLISNNNNCNKTLNKTDELSTNINSPVVTENT